MNIKLCTDLLSTRRKVWRVYILHKALGGTWPCRCRTTCVQLHEPPDVLQETPSSNTPLGPFVLNTLTFHVYHQGLELTTPVIQRISNIDTFKINYKQPTFSAPKTQATGLGLKSYSTVRTSSPYSSFGS